MDPNAVTAGGDGAAGPPPERIGPYRVLGLIGEGGFGVVYEAEQSEPVRRRVAVKVVKAGMDSSAVVSRFEAERQALAVMDHPYIARVFDAGTTAPEQGSRPYFVMELVRGEPITSFCDRSRLGVDERVGLMARVCEAVQHAHAKGVVHRDLKPSNILVAYDAEGRAQPKVIDFGVAKALNQRLSRHTIFTGRGELIGTPEYMSPEQAEMSGLDVDTRADVYSLGVVLYELLTGTLPFDSRTLREAAYTEVQRIIREVDPPKPSTRMWTVATGQGDADLAARIARARQTDARSLAGVLKRDLDWIVMRCLEKDRERRYETASALRAELLRYLAGEAVLAGPAGVGYRVRKFVGRHRGPVAAAGLAAVGLLAAVAVLSVMLGEVRAQRHRAERMVEFLEAPSFAPEVLERAGRETLYVDVLGASADEVNRRFEGDDHTRARLLGAIGTTQVRLGDEPAAVVTLDQARELIEAQRLRGREWAWRAMLAQADALARLRRVDESMQVLDLLAGAAPPTERLGSQWLLQRGGTLKRAGRLDEAEADYRAAMAAISRLDGPTSAGVLDARYDLALVDLERGKVAAAGGDEPASVAAFERARAAFAGVLEDRLRLEGESDARVGIVRSELAAVLSRLRRYDEAAAAFPEAIGTLASTLGPTHWRTLQTRGNLGTTLARAGRPGEAAAELAAALEGYAQTARLGTPAAFAAATVHAQAHSALGAPALAAPWLERVYDAMAAQGDSAPVPAAEVARALERVWREAGDESRAARWAVAGGA